MSSSFACQIWTSDIWCSPWTTRLVVPSNEPLGKVVMLQVYEPASAFSTSLIIKDGSSISTLPFRNVSWTLSPCKLLKTIMMISSPSGGLSAHWTWVISLSFCPGMKWHGRVTSCPMYPVTSGGTLISCDLRTYKKINKKKEVNMIWWWWYDGRCSVMMNSPSLTDFVSSVIISSPFHQQYIKTF